MNNIINQAEKHASHDPFGDKKSDVVETGSPNWVTGGAGFK